MADSDEDYVQDISDDDVEAHQVTRGAGGGSRAQGHGTRGGGWEVSRTWENVVEGADGTINSTVEGLLEGGKRKRYEQRGQVEVSPRCPDQNPV